jgi:hypothetical protein
MGSALVHSLSCVQSLHSAEGLLVIGPHAVPPPLGLLPGGYACGATAERADVVQVPTGPLLCGQTREYLVTLALPSSPPPGEGKPLTQCTLLLPGLEAVQASLAYTAAHPSPAQARALSRAVKRSSIVDSLGGVLAAAERGELQGAKGIALALLEQCSEAQYAGDESMEALRKDVAGRVQKALDGEPRFRRWGRHYLRHLQRSYQCVFSL